MSDQYDDQMAGVRTAAWFIVAAIVTVLSIVIALLFLAS